MRVILLGAGARKALDGANAMAIDTSLMCIVKFPKGMI
jgi:hypothetical protein